MKPAALHAVRRGVGEPGGPQLYHKRDHTGEGQKRREDGRPKPALAPLPRSSWGCPERLLSGPGDGSDWPRPSERWGTLYGSTIFRRSGTELFDQAQKLGVRVLTRNWRRYDANEPITEASEGGIAGVKEVMAKYDKGIALAWENIRHDAAGRRCGECRAFCRRSRPSVSSGGSWQKTTSRRWAE